MERAIERFVCGEEPEREEENYATSSIYKLLFLQYFHLFSEMLCA